MRPKYGLTWPEYIIFEILCTYYYCEFVVKNWFFKKKLKNMTLKDLIGELPEDFDLEDIKRLLNLD